MRTFPMPESVRKVSARRPIACETSSVVIVANSAPTGFNMSGSLPAHPAENSTARLSNAT